MGLQRGEAIGESAQYSQKIADGPIYMAPSQKKNQKKCGNAHGL